MFCDESGFCVVVVGGDGSGLVWWVGDAVAKREGRFLQWREKSLIVRCRDSFFFFFLTEQHTSTHAFSEVHFVIIQYSEHNVQHINGTIIGAILG